MDLFVDEIEKLIRVQAPDISIQKVEEDSHFVGFCFPTDFRSISLVFHFLREKPSNHFEKISKYVSSPGQLVIHLWEDWWKFHDSKVKSRLISLLGLSKRIHGRETLIKSINNLELLSFLKDNHLNVPIKAKYKYGLFMNNNLFAVMSFSKARSIMRNGIEYDSYELLRFCNKLDHTVVGGFSKLLNHFIHLVSPDDIMTYVDRDWSDGYAYQKLGFELESQSDPMEFILNLNTGERLYPESKGLLRQESMVRVFNSGSFKFIKKLK